MLRVRPIHFTSRLDEWERLLTGLGLVKTSDEATWREFDAGSGRLALHFVEEGSAEDGTTSFGVEVGDLAEFARRTNEDGSATGTTAELIEADHGPSCRVTARDGFSFLADPAVRAADGGWAKSAEADPGLAVVGVWFAEDATIAAQTLRNIGALPRAVPGRDDTDSGDTETFAAKNGGILMVGAGTGAGRAGLGFEYEGDLGALRGRLGEAGHEVAFEESAVPTLHVANPDAAAKAGHHPPLWIAAAPATSV